MAAAPRRRYAPANKECRDGRPQASALRDKRFPPSVTSSRLLYPPVPASAEHMPVQALQDPVGRPASPERMPPPGGMTHPARRAQFRRLDSSHCCTVHPRLKQKWILCVRSSGTRRTCRPGTSHKMHFCSVGGVRLPPEAAPDPPTRRGSCRYAPRRRAYSF